MIEFWDCLVSKLEEAALELLDQGDCINARKINDLKTRSGWVAVELRDYDNDHELVQSARRIYASWFMVHMDGIARETAEECVEIARKHTLPR